MGFNFGKRNVGIADRLSLELWLKVEASRRRNDPRKLTSVNEHGAALG